MRLTPSTSPEHPNAGTVYDLYKIALANKVDPYVSFIDEGVKILRDPRSIGLAEEGLKLFVCAYECQQHHISTDGYDKEVTFYELVTLPQKISS